ncbi:lipid A export permease/ATP-binding protein MsbA [Sulfuricystis multivorans]|uniref:lipid A export permease/ATP-binding protein MsbA n=1 Tax=Sulfuricystis multivorans TaxID=2211108 RepID=UPI000F83CDF5|nr:lipid A export permease/ATP-binding protein MsbA [Sulfuricystis multivorans]
MKYFDHSLSGTSSLGLYLRLLGYVRPYWRMLVAAVIGMALTAATEPLFPALMKPLLDGNLGANDPQAWWKYPLAIIGVVALRGLFGFLGGYCMHWLSHRITADLRSAMFARIVRLPTTFFDANPASRIVARVTNDVNGLSAAATTVLTTLVRDSLTIVALLAWMIYLNWNLTLVSLLIIPLVLVSMRYFSQRMRRLSRSLLASYGDMAQGLQEATEGHRVIKIHSAQEIENKRFRRDTEYFRGLNMRISVAGELLMPLIQLIAALALAIVVGIAVHQAHRDLTSVGAFVSFITAMLMLLAPAKRLAGLSMPLQRGLAAAESVFSLLDEPAERDQGRLDPPLGSGSLEVRQVSFSYPHTSRPALNEISFSVRPGEMIAIVGLSGSGKTTLFNLLVRFYDDYSGQILIDGIDSREMTLAALRRRFALVSQDIFLFNDTVAANIAYGNPNATMEEIRMAANAAHATSFIEALPNGFDTQIGDKGVRLSGGQRQRVAIARAVLKKAPILLLDEATSALDSESERYVQAAIEALMGQSTTLVIAHRLSTVRRAQRILVIAKGRIVEAGTHDELIALGGEYKKLYDIQFHSEEKAGAEA